MSYNIAGYNQMITDRVRMEAYGRAARRSIRPGSVVAELGTGNGYFAVQACKLGAKKVYAIEPNKVIEMAVRVAQANGCADRIEFVEAFSTDITLPEKVDVVFSDMRGALPLFGRHIPSIIDARERFLRPGGVLIPEQDDLFVAFVSSQRIYSQYCEPRPVAPEDPDLSLIRPALRTVVMKQNSVQAAECVSGPLHMGTLCYMTVDTSTFRSTVKWVPRQATTVHGVCAWFDATLAAGVTFSTGPFAQEMTYGRLFFPFAEPIDVTDGDSVAFSFEGFLIDGDYNWNWNTVVTASDGAEVKTDLRQSSFQAASVASLGRSFRGSKDYVPRLTPKAELTRFVLERVDGSRSLDAIASQLAASFPDRFTGVDKALTFASDVVERAR